LRPSKSDLLDHYGSTETVWNSVQIDFQGICTLVESKLGETAMLISACDQWENQFDSETKVRIDYAVPSTRQTVAEIAS